MNEKYALMVLNAIPSLGSVRITKLVNYYGSAVNVLALSSEKLLSDKIFSDKIIQNIISFPKKLFLEKELKLIEQHKVDVYCQQDEQYPNCLKEISGAPVVLYVKGNIALEGVSIGIVGSRKASYYGLSMAKQFGSELSDLGITVVSGLARGVDTAVHQGVLHSGGSTVAVLGSGLAHIYPEENINLANGIVGDGAVISEFPMETLPMPYNFPRRNRIISGLSLGVIVVEAAEKSGALITADYALEQGREVYAVPGRIDQAYAKGTNNLIQQGAKLIHGVVDVIKDLNLVMTDCLLEEKAEKLSKTYKELNDDEQSMYQFITDRPIHLDELVHKSQNEANIVASILLQMELKKTIKQLPGKYFVR